MINRERYWHLLMTLAEITDPERPYTRRSFSSRFQEGRAWLAVQMQAAGLETRVDAAGNLIGRLQGSGQKRGVIAIGSHSDTVPHGGRFDGIAGVLAALECALSWRERGVVLSHDVEVIDYLAEEPSEWGISCIGSRGITGFMSDALLATPHPQTSETLGQAIARMGGDPEKRQKREDIAAAFELHIEQGQVLESEGLDVGLVSAIVGIIRLEVLFTGQANHAGTTPMYLRVDALAAAAQLVLDAEALALEMQNEDGYLVATCGQVFAEPNASNVIAGSARLVFDIRADRYELMQDFVNRLQDKAQALAARRGVQLAAFRRLTDTHPAHCDQGLLDDLSASAKEIGVRAKVMVSGAGHDAAFLSHIAPSVMLFVPSKDGKSHCPEEWTDAAALGKGVAVLCAAVERFDKK